MLPLSNQETMLPLSNEIKTLNQRYRINNAMFYIGSLFCVTNTTIMWAITLYFKYYIHADAYCHHLSTCLLY